MCAEKAGKQTIFPGRVLGLEFSNPGFGPGSGFHFAIFRVSETRPVPIPVVDCSKSGYYRTSKRSKQAWIGDNDLVCGRWNSFECSEVARHHSLAPSLTRIEFFSHRKQDTTKRSVRRKLAKNLITLAVIGGSEHRADPARISKNDDELVTFITLGNNKKNQSHAVTIITRALSERRLGAIRFSRVFLAIF